MAIKEYPKPPYLDQKKTAWIEYCDEAAADNREPDFRGCRRRCQLRHAFEIRHESFLDPRFVQLLREHEMAFVVADTAGKFPLACKGRGEGDDVKQAETANCVRRTLQDTTLHGHDEVEDWLF